MRGTRPAPGPSGGSVLTAVSVRAPHSSVLSNQSKPTASLVTHPMMSSCMKGHVQQKVGALSSWTKFVQINEAFHEISHKIIENN